MAIRTIVTREDPILAKTSRKVEEITPRIIQLLDDMRETLIKAEGVGLAAVQVGVLKRIIIVLDMEKEEQGVEDPYYELINPEIVAKAGEQKGYEGCLSVPDIWGYVKRPARVRVRALDRNGNVQDIMCTGTTARAMCHEIDHLDGHLFIEVAEKLLNGEEMNDRLTGKYDPYEDGMEQFGDESKFEIV